jgi:hypothetical protein
VYRERLSPNWWMILAIFLVVPTTVLIFFPISVLVGVVTGVVLWLGSVGALWWFSPVIEVRPGIFRAGRAQISSDHVDSIEVIDKEHARAAKGVELDARAWLVIRPWVGPVVKVVLSDTNDPTPYWLVSTKNPYALERAWKSAGN